jgi:hypothetical protein
MQAKKDPTETASEGSATDQSNRGGGDLISRGGGDLISKGGGDLISKDTTSQPQAPEPDNDAQNAASVRTPF